MRKALGVLVLCACAKGEKIDPDQKSPAPVPTASTAPSATGVGSTNESGSRLKAVYLKGDDGSTQFMSWFDTARNEPCSFQSANGKYYCLPPLSPVSSLYWDSACANSLEAVSKSVTACTQPSLVAVRSSDACDPTLYVFTHGHVYSGLHAFTMNQGSCVAYPDAALATFRQTSELYELGDKIPIEEFVSATVAH